MFMKAPRRTYVEGAAENDASEERQSPYTITEEMLEERLKHENRGRFITQLFPAIAASLAAFSFGIVLGWSSPTKRYLLHEQTTPNLSSEQYAWAASLMPLGCSFGIIPWTYAVDKIGPKHALIILAPLYIIGILTTKTLKLFNAYLTSRFISGFLTIVNLIGGECLMVDTVHRGHLPTFMVFFTSSVWLGVLSAYMIGYLSSDYYLSMACATAPTINSVFLTFLPESPVYLYDKSELKAEKALSWYRGSTNISTEMRSIRKDAEIRKMGMDTHRYMFFSKVVFKGLLIVLALAFLQVFSGYYAFVFYGFLLWNDLRFKFADIMTFGLVLYISNLVATFVHYREPFGVRKPLILSTILITISLSIISIYHFLIYEELLTFVRVVPRVLVCIFVISYEIGLGTYPTILFLEYLPYQVHVMAKCIIRMWFWLFLFLLMKYFVAVRESTNNFGPFAILTLVSFIGVIFCYYCVVETKGKSFIQIQIDIGGNPIGNRGSYRS